MGHRRQLKRGCWSTGAQPIGWGRWAFRGASSAWVICSCCLSRKCYVGRPCAGEVCCFGEALLPALGEWIRGSSWVWIVKRAFLERHSVVMWVEVLGVVDSA